MKIVSKITLGERVRVCLDDGSVWTCSRNGQDWKQEELSDEELLATFPKIEADQKRDNEIKTKELPPEAIAEIMGLK